MSKRIRFKSQLESSIEKPLIQQILGKTRADNSFSSWDSLSIKEFLKAYKIKSGIEHFVNELHLTRIPSEGPTLIIASHPTGITDALVILDSIHEYRNDVKVLLDTDYRPVRSLEPYILSLENKRVSEAQTYSKKIISYAMDWLEKGHCLVVFTQNSVMSEKRLFENKHSPIWHPAVKEIVKGFDGPIVPWGISGKNSPLFYPLSKIHPQIRQSLLPRESLKRKFRPIQSRIGKAFKVSGDYTLDDIELKIRLMTTKPPRIQWPAVRVPKKCQAIAEETDKTLISKEIENLGSPITQKGMNLVFVTSKVESPNIVREIGRLREITFRSVNEGSGKSLDLDSYDEDFKHLVLWDSNARCIIGAYRLGVGPDLHKKKGYHSIIHDFYRQNETTDSLLNQTLVMGRAFVREEYQQKIFPLFLLWQGIKLFVKQDDRIQYLMGQTSLPHSYQDSSKLLISQFIWKHHSNESLRKSFIPYFPLRLKTNKYIDRWVESSSSMDLKRLDKIIECIEPSGAKMPMLFRRYIDQNAKCIGINIDPDFQNSVDILMLTKVTDIPD